MQLEIARHFASWVKNSFSPVANVASKSAGSIASDVERLTIAPSVRTLSPHSGPVNSANPLAESTMSAMNVSPVPALDNDPRTRGEVCRHVFRTLSNPTVGENMFILLVEQFGLEEAIRRSSSGWLGDIERVLKMIRREYERIANS